MLAAARTLGPLRDNSVLNIFNHRATIHILTHLVLYGRPSGGSRTVTDARYLGHVLGPINPGCFVAEEMYLGGQHQQQRKALIEGNGGDSSKCARRGALC